MYVKIWKNLLILTFFSFLFQFLNSKLQSLMTFMPTYLRVLWAQKQCSKFQNFGFSEKKKSYWDSKIHPGCWSPLVLSIFNLPCEAWSVITFIQVISLCWNFQDNLILYIPFIWKISLYCAEQLSDLNHIISVGGCKLRVWSKTVAVNAWLWCRTSSRW